MNDDPMDIYALDDFFGYLLEDLSNLVSVLVLSAKHAVFVIVSFLSWPLKYLNYRYLNTDGFMAFKGFSSDMTCRGKQYREGGLFVHPLSPDLCNHGFHFCRRLTDVFDYYDETDNVYHLVEVRGRVVEDDGKSCTDAIRIGRRLIDEEIHDILLKENPQLDLSDMGFRTSRLIRHYGRTMRKHDKTERTVRPGLNTTVKRVNGRLRRIRKEVPVWN